MKQVGELSSCIAAHAPQDNTPKVISPQAMLISQKLEMGTAIMVMPSTGNSASMPQVKDAKKINELGAERNMEIPLSILFAPILLQYHCNGQSAYRKRPKAAWVYSHFWSLTMPRP